MLSFTLYILLGTGTLIGKNCIGQSSVSHITPYGGISVDCMEIESTAESLPAVGNYELEVRMNALQFHECRALYSQLSETDYLMVVECPGFYAGFEDVIKGK